MKGLFVGGVSQYSGLHYPQVVNQVTHSTLERPVLGLSDSSHQDKQF